MKNAVKLVGLAAALMIMPFIMQSAAAAETIELKMGHFMSPMHIQHQKSFVPFAQELEKLTKGEVKIKIFPGGALGGALELADA
ncbi:MAG TPA: hypothetical protein PKZ12_08180, partial [Smithellaceae bacterium]|nr:hypothetical protein [Smithellaceae bacterium]